MNNFFAHLISFFRIAIHTITGGGSCCKFIPCCSAYAKEAFRRHSWTGALYLVVKRLGRCQPFSKGGYDPVISLGEKNYGV